MALPTEVTYLKILLDASIVAYSLGGSEEAADDVAVPGIGITFGMIHNAQAELALLDDMVLVPKFPKYPSADRARDMIMWLRMSDQTAQGLHDHFNRKGAAIPEWLHKLIPAGSYVPSKGDVATAIYRFSVEDAHK